MSKRRALYQRAKVALSNRGVYLRGASVTGILTASNIIDAISRYEGRDMSKGCGADFGSGMIEAWVLKQEQLSSAPHAAESPYGRPLKLSREMKAALARCNPARLPT